MKYAKIVDIFLMMKKDQIKEDKIKIFVKKMENMDFFQKILKKTIINHALEIKNFSEKKKLHLIETLLINH